MNLPIIRVRREAGVTVGEVLAESLHLPRTLDSSTFDSDEAANYFARPLEWARHPHKLVLRPLARLAGGAGSSADDVCTATGLVMHELDDPSHAASSGEIGSDQSVYREISVPVTTSGMTSAATTKSRPDPRADGFGDVARTNEIRRSRPVIQPRFFDKIEAFISKLSMRDNFWNSVCSLIWLPLAFFSGLRMKEIDQNSFAARAILPFRRFNRNWYRAMAGGALLANSEIAGGGYVFGICGADYTVVCKNLNYTFLRPCFGPAVYRMQPREDIKARLATQKEFNITIDMDITQQASRRGEKDKRVGKCEATFHVTPKAHHMQKRARRRDR